MTTADHVAGEDLMAHADGELTGAERRTVEEHVAVCERCAGEVARLQNEGSTLNGWSVPKLPKGVETTVLERLNGWSTGPEAQQRWADLTPRRRLWYGAAALATGAVTVALFIFGGSPSSLPLQSATQHSAAGAAPPAPPASAYSRTLAEPRMAVLPESKERFSASQDYSNMMRAPAPPPSGVDALRRSVAATSPGIDSPMIARTVNLTLIVKDIERSRKDLEELLRIYSGYAAQMEVSTPEAGKRSLQASLRVPSGQLRGMLAELKGYGKVASETQTGEEVGQQHADLVARLSTARESEERLRGILKSRTGGVSDVLQVEREIARVREQIESMEAEQQSLEHRVTYATVELQMYEEGGAPTGATAASRLGAGARQGWQNATESALGLTVFVLQYGLATLLFVASLGIPVWLAWRRWRTPRATRL